MFKNNLCSFFLLFPSLCMGRRVWEGALTCACAQRPQFHSGYFSYCFHSIWSSAFQWAWWASNLWDLLFALRALELQCVLLFLVITVSVRDLHSGPHPCTAGTLPTDPSPWLFSSFFIVEDSSEWVHVTIVGQMISRDTISCLTDTLEMVRILFC